MNNPPAHLRYVVLRHEGVAEPHFDFMFETAPGSTLRSYRVNDWPIGPETTFVRVPDHRRQYLDYEGVVSRGRGHVKCVAAGTCACTVREDGSVHVVLEDGTEVRAT